MQQKIDSFALLKKSSIIWFSCLFFNLFIIMVRFFLIKKHTVKNQELKITKVELETFQSLRTKLIGYKVTLNAYKLLVVLI